MKPFRISDKVVCLDDFNKMLELEPRFKQLHPVIPEKGKVYTVRDVIDVEVPNSPIKGLYLTGIQSFCQPGHPEQPFSSFSFQHLEDYKNKKFGGEYDYLDL